MGSVPTDELEHLDTLLLRNQAVDIKAAQAILADAALSVKERVTKLANSVDSERRHDMDAASMRDFSARGSFAEDAVCMAYGFLIGPLTVVSLSREGVLEGVSYYNPGILAAAAHHFVFNDVRKVHYEALLPLADPPCRGISCVLRVTAARECCDVCGLPLHGSCLRRHRPPCAAAAEVTAQIATQAAAAAALQAQGQGDDGDDCEGSPSDSEGTTRPDPDPAPDDAVDDDPQHDPDLLAGDDFSEEGATQLDPASTQLFPDPVSPDIDQRTQDAILDIARKALPLHALAPTCTWRKEQRDAWESALTTFAERISGALDADGNAVVNLVHDFLRLPAEVLIPFLDKAAGHNPHLRTFLANQAADGNPLVLDEDNSLDAARARGAAKQLRWGRKGKALRALLSNGIANEHERCEDIMRQMHPAPSRLWSPPDDLGPGLEAETNDVKLALDKLFSKDFSAMDFSGWSRTC